MPCRRNTPAAATTTSTNVCDRIIPAAAAERLADAVDVFCESIAFSPAAMPTRLRGGRAARLAGQGPRRAAFEPWRRPACGTVPSPLGRSPRTPRRRGRAGHRQGRQRGRAAAGRVLLPARNAETAGRAAPRGWRADGGGQRPESRHFAAGFVAADARTWPARSSA